MNLTYIIKRPIITEKSLLLAGVHKYTFEVDPRATKKQIRVAVEKYFKVKVIGVRTINMVGKRRRRPGRKAYSPAVSWKKAILELPKDQRIDLFETEESVKEKKKSSSKKENMKRSDKKVEEKKEVKKVKKEKKSDKKK